MKTLFLSLMIFATALSGAQVKAYPLEGSAAVKVTVSVRSLSEVAGPKFTLGEIADVTADAALKAKIEQLDMGLAPVAGIPRPIVASRIQSMLMVAGLKTSQFEIRLPADAHVALKVQKVGTEKFVQAALQAVQRQLGAEIPMTCPQTFPEFVAPLGDLSLEAGSVSKNQSGFSVMVAVSVNGKRVNSRLITLTVDAMLAATAIKAGDTVKILLRNAGATIQVTGKARSGGMMGQQITVVSSTGSVHQATVTGAGQVEVKL